MKDRERTEKKILDAIGSIITGDGFEGIGINAVAQKAGVSKMLIYRYFGGLDELISSYLLHSDSPPSAPGMRLVAGCQRVADRHIDRPFGLRWSIARGAVLW